MLSIRATDDLELIYSLDRSIFLHDAAIPTHELDDSLWWVAELDGEPVGFAGLQLQREDSTPHEPYVKAYLLRAGVAPEARGAGLQQRLIRARVAAAKRLGISRVYTYVWAGNLASLRSLIKCGFLPYYVERPKDQTWIYLEKMLAPVPQLEIVLGPCTTAPPTPPTTTSA